MADAAAAAPAIAVAPAPAGFDHWDALLALILGAFAGMEGRIDPPSSALRLTPGSLADKARAETLLLAREGDDLVGCVFVADRGDTLYVGKLAVRPDRQHRGIGRALMQAVEVLAHEAGCASLELETRIELTGNHRTFERLGFRRTGERAHAGYDRPTSIIMRKRLAPPD